MPVPLTPWIKRLLQRQVRRRKRNSRATRRNDSLHLFLTRLEDRRVLNAGPVINFLDGDMLSYGDGDGAQPIDQTPAATVTDPDAGFAQESLTVSFVSPVDSTEDVLGIRDQGTGAGQIGVSGNEVTYEGLVFATFSGGQGGDDLVVEFNPQVTTDAKSALLQNITYENTDADEPTTGEREITFVLTKRGGKSSEPVTATVDVQIVNDPPELTAPESQTVMEDVLSPINGIAVDDDEADLLQVELSVGQGILTLGDANIEYLDGTESGSEEIKVRGSIEDLNNALAQLEYLGNQDYNGPDTLAITVTELDTGSTGEPLSVSGGVALTVDPVNDAPVADAGGLDYFIDAGLDLMLDASATTDVDIETNGDTLTYNWDFDNDGATDLTTDTAKITVPWQDLQTLPAIPLGVGSHTIVLVVTDAGGLTSSDDATLNISDHFIYQPVTDGVTDRYTLALEADKLVVTDTDSGIVLSSVAADGVNRVTINGSDDDDRVTVKFYDDSPILSGGLFVHGNNQTSVSGGDELRIEGENGFSSLVYTATAPGAGLITLDETGTIQFDNLESVKVTSTVKTVTVEVDHTDDHAMQFLSNGTDQTEVVFDGGLVSMVFVNPKEELIVSGDVDNNDTITFSLQGNIFDASITTDGRGGTDQIIIDTDLSLGSASNDQLSLTAESIDLGANVTTTGRQEYRGLVTLTDNVVLKSSSDGGGDIIFTDNIKGDHLLTLAAGTGQIDFLSTVGDTTPLNGLLVNSAATVNFQDTVAVAGGGIDITAGVVSFDQTVTTTGGGSVLIGNSGQLTIAGDADMVLDGSFTQNGSGPVSTAGDITTSSDPISFATEVTLTGNVELDTGGGAGDITFSDSVHGDQKLTVAAGTGAINFLSTVGDTIPLSGLLVNSAVALNFDGTVAVDDQGIDVTAGVVTVDRAVSTTGGGSVEITNSGQLTIASAADMVLDGSFTQNGSGPVSTAGDITTSGDPISFATDVTLTDGHAVSLNTGANGGNIAFQSTLDGSTDSAEDLKLTAGTGSIMFTGAVGGTTDLGGLLINSAQDVTFSAALNADSLTQVAGTGDTQFKGPVTLEGAGGLAITTNTVTLNATIDTLAAGNGGTVTILAGGNVTMSADGDIFTDDADVEMTAGNAGLGGSLTMSDGTLIDVGRALIRLTGDGDVILGGLMTANTTDAAVILASTSGAVVDGGDANVDVLAPNGGLVIDAAAGIGDTSVAGAADSALETTVASLYVDSGSSGSIAIDETDEVSVQHLFNVTTSDGDGSTGTVTLTSGGSMTVDGDGVSAVDGDITLDAGASETSDVTVNAPIQNLDGEGGIRLVAGQDLVINDTLADVDVGIHGQVATIVGSAGRDVTLEPGTVIATGTGFIEVPTETAGIAPIVILVPVDQERSSVGSPDNALIEVTIVAPFGQNFEILVDWSDGTIDRYLLPQDSPLDGTQVYTFTHSYTTYPAKPIPVSVTVAYDGREPVTGDNADNGIAFYQNGGVFIETTVFDELTVPVPDFIIVVENEIDAVGSVVRNEIDVVELHHGRSDVLVLNQATAGREQDNWLETQSAESEFGTSTPVRLFLRRVDSSGKEGDDVELPITLLEEGLLDAFSRLPNGRYRVYYQEPNSERVRMVREVHVHQGRVVPPDFRENVGERQPGGKQAPDTPEDAATEATDQNQEGPAKKGEPQEPAPAAAGPADSASDAEAPAVHSTDAATSAAVAAIGVAAVDGGQRWSEQVDRAYLTGRRSLTQAARLCRRLRREKTKS